MKYLSVNEKKEEIYNDDTPLYNIRILRSYINYINEHYPSIDFDKLLKYAGVTKFQYNDLGYWCNQRQMDKFQDILIKETSNPNISREVGRNLTSSQNFLSLYVLSFLNPVRFNKQITKLYNKLSKAVNVKIKYLSDNKCEYITVPAVGVTEKPYQCKNRIGSIEGVLKIFLNQFPVIEHPECLHKGAKYCRYVVSWDRLSKSYSWIKIRNHSIVIGTVLSLLALIFLPIIHALLIVLFSLSGVLYLTQRSFRLEKEKMQKEFSEVSQTAEDYWTELNAGYNVTKLVQEVGEITSVIQSKKQIVESISGVMNKRLEYERGAIFLSQDDKTTLFFAGGYGFSKDEIDLMDNAQFKLTNINTEGIFQKVFIQQKPVVIENMSKIIPKLNPPNRIIVERLKIKSFLCVPIVYESESLGVMVVDSLKYQREFRESDINLLMAVSSQTALSIAYARAFRKLQESERKHRALVETVKDIVYTLNLEGRFTYISPIAETITGYNNKDLLGCHFVEIIAPAYKKTVLEHFAEGVQSGNTSTYEIEIITKDEKIVPVELKVASLTDNMGQSIGRIGVARDITRRKMEETARKELEVKALTQDKLASLGEIATGIAHEINQPLSYIKIILEATLRDISENSLDKEELYDDFDESLRQTEKISKIISHLRIFGRSNITSLEPVRLSKVIDDALILMHERLRIKNIQLKKEIKEDFPLLKGNHSKLEQIFINLIQNSMDAMEKKEDGEIILTANIENDKALIIYSDNGQGIEPKTREKIFEPFFTTKESGKGTGIGLSIVYGIIQEHNGAITCESEEDNGTIFKISLPFYNEITE